MGYMCGHAPACAREIVGEGAYIYIKLNIICSKSQGQNNIYKIDHDPKLKALIVKVGFQYIVIQHLKHHKVTGSGRFNSKGQNNIRSTAWHP